VGYRIRIAVTRIVWGILFLAILFVPLALTAGAGGRGDLMIELSLVFGLLAASVLVCAVVLPSRLRNLTNAFGIERVLRSHRWLGLLALNLVLLHVLLVVLDDPSNLHLLNPLVAPNRARAATGATVGLILLCLLALGRRRLHRTYEWWRWIHVGVAFAVLALTGLHVLWLNHLVRDPAVRTVFVVISALVIGVLANRWVLRPLLDYRHAFVVDEVRHEAPTATTLLLRPLRHRHPGLHFSPGQFAWLRLQVIPVVSDPGPGWTGRVGRVDERLLGQLLPRRRNRQQIEVFICGPAPMVTGVLAALSRLGVPERRVHTEQFDMA